MEKYIVKGHENSMNRFVQDIAQQEFFESSFPQEENIVPQKSESKALQPNMKIDRKRSIPAATTSLSNNLKKPEASKKKPKFDYLPVLKGMSNQKPLKPNDRKDTKQEKQSASYKQLLRRLPCLITGTVEFIIKVHKENPDIEIIYEVYGRMINVVKGKYPFEKLIFVRGSTGPVLQGVFYEIDYNISFLQGGQNICCVGKFRLNNKFHLFKIKPAPVFPSDEALNRLQNVSTFTISRIN